MVMGTTKLGFTPGILRITGCESRLPVYSSGNIVLISCCTITMATYYNKVSGRTCMGRTVHRTGLTGLAGTPTDTGLS